MAITEPTKSRATRARDENPPKSSKPRAKPGPKAKNGPRTTARFAKDECVMAAVDFLQKTVQHRPDLDEALPLGGYLHRFRASMVHEVEEAKVQRDITSFFNPWGLPEDIPHKRFDCNQLEASSYANQGI
ncbi:hypothetical protein DFH09DRAFT_1112108 [Mycena vulgaris]|nr:hypothetical protein DFH09DRAFT_1112108 [Mycena vulgaris]